MYPRLSRQGVGVTRPATSNDVAKKAGVSRAAVSAVLNGAKANIRVSEQTRRRILAAAAELQYSPNPIAQSLRRQRSGTIAFVYGSSSRSLYERTVPYQLGRLIMRAAVNHGYQVIEVDSETYSARGNEDTLRLLLSRRVDGVVFGWAQSSLEIQRMIDSGLPVVQVMKPQPASRSSTIVVDASRGIKAAVDHLVSLGHERIAFLGSSDPHPIERARLDCFVDALKQHNIRAREEYFVLGTAYSLAEGYSFTHALLALPERPTALFVVDSLAFGVLRALYEVGVRVPEGISVVGYDNLLAAHLYPPLTSVVQPIQEVADHAISLVDEQVIGPNEGMQEPTHIVLPTHLEIRSSTQEP